MQRGAEILRSCEDRSAHILLIFALVVRSFGMVEYNQLEPPRLVRCDELMQGKIQELLVLRNVLLVSEAYLKDERDIRKSILFGPVQSR